jgi:hypothetical protein
MTEQFVPHVPSNFEKRSYVKLKIGFLFFRVLEHP